MYRILSLDGGGIRGLFTARILWRLENARPGTLASIDLFAGTSTGGILALGLALGLSPAMIEQFYLGNAVRIFSTDTMREIQSLFDLRAPKYSNAGLRDALTEIFGDRTLRDLRRQVVVTTYDCAARRPLDFTGDTLSVRCIDAAMATSAAQVYFPAFQNYLVDGGTSANNPSMAAVAWAVADGHPFDSVAVLSVGTGNARRPPLSPLDWGAVQWLENGLIDLLLDAPAQRNDAYCRDLLGRRYFRVDGSVDCPMDETAGLEAKLLAPADALDLAGALGFLGGLE